MEGVVLFHWLIVGFSIGGLQAIKSLQLDFSLASPADLVEAINTVLGEVVRSQVVGRGVRHDGRKPGEIRGFEAETNVRHFPGRFSPFRPIFTIFGPH